jgi:hypothetical protein
LDEAFGLALELGVQLRSRLAIVRVQPHDLLKGGNRCVRVRCPGGFHPRPGFGEDHLLLAIVGCGVVRHDIAPDAPDQIEITELPEEVAGCEECLAMGSPWCHLRICLECGKVGCCDSSPNRHASRHAREVSHPLVQSFEPGAVRRLAELSKVRVVALLEPCLQQPGSVMVATSACRSPTPSVGNVAARAAASRAAPP